MRQDTEERYKKARQMYELGMTNDEIAAAIGVSPVSVNKILNLAGVKKQKVIDTTKRDDMIQQLFQEGMSQTEIAELTGHSTSLIWDIINNKGRYRGTAGAFVGEFEEPVDLSGCTHAAPRKPLERCRVNGKSYIDVTPLFGG